MYLADKSALVRFNQQAVFDEWGELFIQGQIATCPIIDLEVLYSARSLKDYESILAERKSLPSFPITPQSTDRAIEVQHRLCEKAHHRLPIPDLLIAAVAEENNLVVLHYDSDFDQISKITKQATRWIVPQGSI